MQGIEFETDQSPVVEYQNTTQKRSGMMRLLGKLGIDDPILANFVLLGLAAIFFGVAIFLYAGILVEPKKDWSLDAKVLQQRAQQYVR